MLKGKKDELLINFNLLHPVTAMELSEKKVRLKKQKGVGRIVGANKFHNA